jgi:nitrite reductase (NADH) large subunit
MEAASDLRPTIVVVGNGMVGHRLLDELKTSGIVATHRVIVIGEEPRLAYDRVHLTELFEGKTADDLSLAPPGGYDEWGVEVRLSDKVIAIDRDARVVTTEKGERLAFDWLVLATGSFPFVPPVPGKDAAGCFVYRTIEDIDAIRAWPAEEGIVVGGGLLGLEAANALRGMGVRTHVVELSPRLLAMQIDDLGGALLSSRVAALGVSIHTGTTAKEIVAEDGRVRRVVLSNGKTLDVGVVVFSAGIRPRDELARACGLTLGPRGGIAVDDQCRTSDPSIFAVGECASHRGSVFGLVGPGYQMARVVASVLVGGASAFDGGDTSAKLKLMGVDVASFGDAFGATPGSHVVSFQDTRAGVYKKLILSPDKKRLLGGMLVGEASAYGTLASAAREGVPLPGAPEDLILPPRAGEAPKGLGVDALPASATLCSCHNVTKGTVCDAIRGKQLTVVSEIKGCTKAGTGCGSCVTLLSDLLKAELKKAGITVTNHVCEHFPHSRQELYHLVRLHKLKTFDAVLSRHGTGHGCEICKPAVASILASAWNEHVLSKRHLPLQDTNDRYLANIQKDGTYSVIPRVPGGEITPDRLIALGRIAKSYGLYCKITGGQRVDLLGARLEQLPAIWAELVAEGFESGHAYGKALRTVKSCVGSTWCRYGVQDSVTLAIAIEERYRGLRSPHKLKSAVSGCARECAEAQGKDFGIIATEQGYNLYLCGNGGMKPQHAQLFATDIDEATLIRYLDRFLMFYIRTADRLQRTSTWFNSLEGGMEYLREVIIHDSLGICAELEAEMAHHVATYRCEWKETLSDPEKLQRFRPFVNSDQADPSIVFVTERGQPRPAREEERAAFEETSR